MKDYPVLRLRKGREISLVYRHPWIFSGALEKTEHKPPHGALVHLHGADGSVMATGTWSAYSSIAVRIFEFRDSVIDLEWFKRMFEEAYYRRYILGYGPGTATTGYRVVFGESDGLPGLVVDRYNDIFVMQLSTKGMDNLRSVAVEALTDIFSPRAIIERSDLKVRREERMPMLTQQLLGEPPGLVAFQEKGMHFLAAPAEGQKTGFYLDQKDLRQTITRYARGRRVLNLFSNSGASGIAAMKGGALSVHNVDCQKEALDLCETHAAMNGIDGQHFTTEKADIFSYFDYSKLGTYDMVILDPPALIKAKKDLEDGLRSYHFLNRAAMRLLNKGGILVTSSCSHFLKEDEFALVLRRASVQAESTLQILDMVRQSPDHPQSVYFPEALYLKSFVCLLLPLRH